MKYGPYVGWGIVLYAILYLTESILRIHGITGTLSVRLIDLLVLIVSSIIAGRSLGFTRWTDILPYSIAWAIVVALIDFLVSFPVTGVSMYHQWSLWVGYAFVVILPLLAPLTRPSYQESIDVT